MVLGLSNSGRTDEEEVPRDRRSNNFETLKSDVTVRSILVGLQKSLRLRGDGWIYV